MPGADLLSRIETPAYVYNLEDVRQAYRQLKQALPSESKILYSLKANPHPMLVKTLHDLGAFAEVSSVGELDCCLQIGLDGRKCVYTGPAKTTTELAYAIEHQVHLISVESWHELERVDKIARRYGRTVNVIIRINPERFLSGSGVVMTGVSSQFGIDESQLYLLPSYLEACKQLRFQGFHIYTGTNVTDAETLLTNFINCITVMKEIAEELALDLCVLDVGGGFSHPYAAKGERKDYRSLKETLEQRLDHSFANWRRGKPQVYFESGRYLVGGCGQLITTIQDIKESKDETFVILDSGIHHLGGMSGLNRIPRMKIDMLGVDEQAGSSEQNAQKANIVGPLCTPLDWFARGLPLHHPKIGNRISIPNVGAYGLTASLMGFLSRELPFEIVVDGQEIVHISQPRIEREERGVSRCGPEVDRVNSKTYEK